MRKADAVVIGGGFFGCSIAAWLQPRMGSVMLIEQEQELFCHASHVNQARIHNGYHYPRSLQTAYSSRINFKRFVKDYPDCVVDNFTSLYGIGRHRSKVNARQFARFCGIIGAPCRDARPEHVKLFDPRTTEAVFEVTEFVFDSNVLRDTLRRDLDRLGVDIRIGTRVERVDSSASPLLVFLSDGTEVECRYLFNCTYAGLRRIPGLACHCQTFLKQEIAEIALIEPPPELRNVGITVMCGPFFSTLPFPMRSLHTLSHVRYTPHCSWIDQHQSEGDPYETLQSYARVPKSLYMLKDAQRFVPSLARARLVESLFEVKTLLVRNEIDDGRPILMERSKTVNTIYSIMGGKIDNIYDIIHRLQAEGL